MKDKILTAKEALILTNFVKSRIHPNLYAINAKINELALQGKTYLILKDNELNAYGRKHLTELGYQVHSPLEYLDVCVIKWDTEKVLITTKDLKNPISLKYTTKI